MRPLLEEARPDVPAIPDAWWRAAHAAEASQVAHDALANTCPPLHALRLRQPANATPPGDLLRVGAWNVERLKFPDETAARIAEERLGLVLLTEVDIGMARSGNRDTVEAVAGTLGMGHAFAVEYVELGLGDEREKVWHDGQTNAVGLHGNAVLSCLPITRAVCIRLDDGGSWFRAGGEPDQRRVGARCAVAVEVDWHGPLWAIAVHLESRGDPQTRAAEMRRLLACLSELTRDDPVVIGGDFNTASMPSVDPLPDDLMDRPEAREPLFAAAREHGFDWRAVNDARLTQRTRPDGTPTPPFNRIDWFVARGVRAQAPKTVPAIDHGGRAISDHELLTVSLTRPPA